MTVRPVPNTGQVLAYLPWEHPAVLSEPAFITPHLPDGDSASWGSAPTWSSVAAEGHVLRRLLLSQEVQQQLIDQRGFFQR